MTNNEPDPMDEAVTTLTDLLADENAQRRLDAATTLLENAWALEDDEEARSLYLGEIQVVDDGVAPHRLTVYESETGDTIGTVSAGEIRKRAEENPITGESDE